MPVYEFKCLECTEKNEKVFTFELIKPISEAPLEAECPVCKTLSKTKVWYAPAIHYGMTRVEKEAGTTKNRFDQGKRMRDERDKRKKQADPDSKDAHSNELWTGTEVERGVIDAPAKKRK